MTLCHLKDWVLAVSHQYLAKHRQCMFCAYKINQIFSFQMSGQGTVQKGGLEEKINNVISLSVLLKLLQLQADIAKEREQTLLQSMVKWR